MAYSVSFVTGYGLDERNLICAGVSSESGSSPPKFLSYVTRDEAADEWK